MNYKIIILSALITGTNACMGMQHQSQNAQVFNANASAPFMSPTNSIRVSYQQPSGIPQNSSAPVMSLNQINLQNPPAYQQQPASNDLIRQLAELTQALHAVNNSIQQGNTIVQQGFATLSQRIDVAIEMQRRLACSALALEEAKWHGERPMHYNGWQPRSYLPNFNNIPNYQNNNNNDFDSH